VFFRIPPATLRELVPLFGSVDQGRLGEQLKLLSSLDSSAVQSMVFFLKAVRVCMCVRGC
jgi:hypothetical protein